MNQKKCQTCQEKASVLRSLLLIGRAVGGPRAIARCKGNLEQALAPVARKPREQLRVLLPSIKFWSRLY